MIRKYGRSEVLINSVFPNHPKVGQIPLSSFYELAQNIKKKVFKERFKDKYEIQTKKYAYQDIGKVGRSISSVAKPKVVEENFNISWLLAFLGVLGAVFTFIRRRQDYR